MTGLQNVHGATTTQKHGKSDMVQRPDPAVCRIDIFVDREVEITRCLASGSCPHRRSYQGNHICSYPDIATNLASTAVT